LMSSLFRVRSKHVTPRRIRLTRKKKAPRRNRTRLVLVAGRRRRIVVRIKRGQGKRLSCCRSEKEKKGGIFFAFGMGEKGSRVKRGIRRKIEKTSSSAAAEGGQAGLPGKKSRAESVLYIPRNRRSFLHAWEKGYSGERSQLQSFYIAWRGERELYYLLIKEGGFTRRAVRFSDEKENKENGS